MKNTNLNQFMMLLMLSVTTAGVVARPAIFVEEEAARYGTLPIGLDTHYDVEETDADPQYVITSKETARYREVAAPVDFTVEAPSILKVGENPDMPFVAQINLAEEKLANMGREEDAKDLSEVAFRLEIANNKIVALRLLEGNPKAYDREIRIAKKDLEQAKHEYRKATHGSKRN